MFNQFRNALEQVTQQLDPNASPENGARSSLDMPISSLRKTFAAQRQNSADGVPKTTSISPPATATNTTRKSTLEERLRRAAASAAASTDNASSTSKPGAPSPVTRGRTDSTTSQKATASRVASPSPAPRGRTTETSKAAVSRTSSPATKTTTARTTASPATAARIGSRPPSRAASPAPAAASAARTSSRPPSRAASPAPTAKPSSRPPSRAASPAPTPRTRASELSGKSTRAASPSPLRGKTPTSTPLRRGSITVGSTPLGGGEPGKNGETEEGPKESQFGEKEKALEREQNEEVEVDKQADGKVQEETSEGDTTLPIEATNIRNESDTADAETHSRTSDESTSSASEPSTASEVPRSPETATQITEGVSVLETSAAQPDLEPKSPTNTKPDDRTVSPVVTDVPHLDSVKHVAEAPAQSEQEIPVTNDPAAQIADPAISSPPAPPPEEEAHTTSPIQPDVETEPVTLQPQVNSSPVAAPTLPAAEQTPFSLEGGPTATKSPTVANASPVVPLSSPCPEKDQASNTPIIDRSAEVEGLQARLKEVEQRFTDVSTSFKRLQAEKLAADAVLKENTPLEGIHDSNAIKEFFLNLKTKDEVFHEEIKRLNGKLEVQDDRMEDIRETHKLESHSLTEELQKLRTQLSETEALFEAAQRATTNIESASEKLRGDVSRLEKEVENSKGLAKEEEEKRVKAISLLKTVRQKLVKAEKDREDTLREMAMLKDKATGDKDREQVERAGFQRELEATKNAHEQEMAALKAQYERELAATKQRYEREISTVRGQHELELSSAKSSYTKDITAKLSQISTLENSLNSVTKDKNSFFDQLLLRQAEVESAQSHLDSLQHQNTELEFQLRESNDRLALLREEYTELQRESDTRSREPTTSPDEVARMISAAEAKYELKIVEMKRNMAELEKERSDSEGDWSRKLKEKVKELEDLKRLLGSATKSRETEESTIAGMKEELEKTKETNKKLQREVAELPILRGQVDELERSSRENDEEVNMKIHVLEKNIEEHKAREAQLKQGNKTLRDELRKVQSSAALLERQRNPGVGYWTTRTGDGPATPNNANTNGNTSSPRPSISGPPPDTPSRTGSPAPSTAGSNKDEEEVNLEYLRNVILQFLEHKEMRPHLVKVMSIILHFTPQETRRLIAKI